MMRVLLPLLLAASLTSLAACGDDSGEVDMAACPATTCGPGETFNRTTCKCEATPADMAKHD